MSDNRIFQQVQAMFGVFMVVFYLGVGIFLLFFSKEMFNIDRSIRGIIGGTLLFYGLYRVFTTYKQISEAFFNKNKNDE